LYKNTYFCDITCAFVGYNKNNTINNLQWLLVSAFCSDQVTMF